MRRKRTRMKQEGSSFPTRGAAKRLYLGQEMRRLYRAMRNDALRVEVGWFRHSHLEGSYVAGGGTGTARIRVNPFWNLVSVVVHELYHHLEPRLAEERVRAFELFIANAMSLGQQQRIFRHFRQLWFATVAEQRRRGKHTHPCPLCGQALPDEE